MTAIIHFINQGDITVEVNGNCYITDEEPNFPVPLGRVVVESEEGTKVFDDAKLIECASVDGRFWFSLSEVPEDEKLRNRIEELEGMNAMLEECILEMSEIIYA